MTIDDIAIFNRMSASETFRSGKAFEPRSVDRRYRAWDQKESGGMVRLDRCGGKNSS
jgi:hypothetical protein